ncbi:hypothetical protein EYC84_001105 [Monilinia fructicola]|uniref:Uncharacterized protein n=1 Tax=Monilinia fructicola TaxID=38448 RepID=A0A5M9JJ39_MONFR|nr:hypothetical protein EYC84_001105 [Monilinia fructicola]
MSGGATYSLDASPYLPFQERLEFEGKQRESMSGWNGDGKGERVGSFQIRDVEEKRRQLAHKPVFQLPDDDADMNLQNLAIRVGVVHRNALVPDAELSKVQDPTRDLSPVGLGVNELYICAGM